ncbi:hypothetical protein BH11PAT2_BH11PAT2_00410 [soil metagenome]
MKETILTAFAMLAMVVVPFSIVFASTGILVNFDPFNMRPIDWINDGSCYGWFQSNGFNDTQHAETPASSFDSYYSSDGGNTWAFGASNGNGCNPANSSFDFYVGPTYGTNGTYDVAFVASGSSSPTGIASALLNYTYVVSGSGDVFTPTTPTPSVDYSLPIDPSDFSTTTSLFDHDSVSSQMTRYDGTVFYGNDADINNCVDAQGCYDGHHGIDFGTSAEGKNILAAASGTVATLGWENPSDHNQGYGYYMRLYHPQFDQSTIYGHATTTASFFSVNDTVNRGDTILLSGATGAATGPHLHFGVDIGNTAATSTLIDPFGWTGTSTDPRTNDKGYLWRTNPPSL